MKNLEVWISLCFILFGAIFFKIASSMQYYSEYGPGPGLLPMWISGILVVLAIVNLVSAFKRNNTLFSDLLPKGTSLINLCSSIGAFALFIIIVPYVGFVLTSMIMLFILFSRGYSWKMSIVLSALVTGVVFFVFNSVLSIPLPVNEFGW